MTIRLDISTRKLSYTKVQTVLRKFDDKKRERGILTFTYAILRRADDEKICGG
jgi:hypothetical protein